MLSYKHQHDWKGLERKMHSLFLTIAGVLGGILGMAIFFAIGASVDGMFVGSAVGSMIAVIIGAGLLEKRGARPHGESS